MRFVVDANVIISASLSKFSVLKVSLYKPKLEKYFLLEDTRPGILSTVLKYSTIIIPVLKVRACRDPKDDMYLELALSGKADCIVSGDPDLQVLNPFENIPIISPKEFLDRFS